MASECVKALGRYLDLGPVTRQRSSRNSFQVVRLTCVCFPSCAKSFSQHLGLAVVPCQLRQGRGSDNRCSWRRTSPVTTKSSSSQQLQSTQVRLEYNRIPVLCSLTSGSARASPKGESFCKGIPYGLYRKALSWPIAFRGAVARKVRLRFWLVRHSNACFAAELERKRFVAAVSRPSFVCAEVSKSCYHCPGAYCCRHSRSPTVCSSRWVLEPLRAFNPSVTWVCAPFLRMLTQSKTPLISGVGGAHDAGAPFFLQAKKTAMTWHNLADSVMGCISARSNLWRAARWKDTQFKTCHCPELLRVILVA